MRNTSNLFGFIAALGLPLALSACLTGETELGHADASVANCGQGGGPVDVANDPHNCGACSVQCSDGKICQQGQCVVQNTTCESGFADCNANAADGCEVNVNADPNHCGSCGASCSSGSSCSNGQCQPPAGQLSCGGVLVDPKSDPLNCGSCGKICSLVNSQAGCVDGFCGVLNCTQGFADCDAEPLDGCETDLTADAKNCGACGSVCASGQACVAGTCSNVASQCDANRADCDGSTANGCEVDLTTNPNHCGACGRVCATGASCVSGTCVNVSNPCTANRSNCDNDTSNGCEVALSADTANCGACGNACASDKICVQGQCAYADIICQSGYANCNATLADGCEVNTATNPSNCGACANVCQGGYTCVNGACQVPTGLINCGGTAVDLSTNLQNCGACGMACPSNPHGTVACTDGLCVNQCIQGHGNCDNMVSNGCEVDLSADVSNCGACGKVCASGYTCNQGSCVEQGQTCTTGFADCDNTVANGCEVNLSTSSTNCGACGKVCSLPNATPMCSVGACVIAACATGYGNCNNDPTDGCEVNLGSSISSCGSCNVSCNFANTTSTCNAGVCAIAACASGYANCDASSSNGCETNTSSSNTNCGSCANVCPTGKQCSAGLCV